jgi:hypothetical protein
LGWLADSTAVIRSDQETEGIMKARHLACAAVGLACLVPMAAQAQYTAYMPAVSQEQIAVNVRAAGLSPLSRPALRGAVYYLRAMSRANVEMRVAVDARSGRVLSATRVSDTQRAAVGSPVPDAPPRYEPRVRGSGYSETAPLPPADVPVAAQPAPAQIAAPPATAKKLAAQPPRAPAAGSSAAGSPAAATPAASAAAAPATETPAANASAAPAAPAAAAGAPAATASAAPSAPAGEVTGAVQAQPAKPPAPASADLRPAIPATSAPAKPPAITMVPIAPLE